MAFASTALSLLGKVASIGLTGAGIASMFAKPKSLAMPGGSMMSPYGGGFPMMSGSPFTTGLLGLGAGAAAAGLGPFTPGSPYGGIGEPGGWFGGSTSITPSRTGRLPKLVMVPSPSNPSTYVTYVRAPAVRYRVSISSARRRCVGGR